MEIIKNLELIYCKCSRCKKIIQRFKWETVNKVVCYECQYKQSVK